MTKFNENEYKREWRKENMKKIAYTSCIAQLDTSIRNCTLTAAGVRLISGWSLNTCRPRNLYGTQGTVG